MTSFARTPIQTEALLIPDAKCSVVIIEPLRSGSVADTNARRSPQGPRRSRPWISEVAGIELPSAHHTLQYGTLWRLRHLRLAVII
jgi:hypothetical protein